MRRIGALLAACGCRHPRSLKEGEHRVQEHLFAVSSNQTRAEFGQDRMVKARVGEFQTEGILEVDPAAYCIGSLPVGKADRANCITVTNAKRHGASAGCPVWENK